MISCTNEEVDTVVLKLYLFWKTSYNLFDNYFVGR